MLVSDEKLPSLYFKYRRKSDSDSSRLHRCEARRRAEEESRGSLSSAWRCAKWLISWVFLKFHGCEAASANESFRGFLKSEVKGAKSGTRPWGFPVHAN